MSLHPNQPPKIPGYYWFIDLRNGIVDIVSVFEGYKVKRRLLYTFFNDDEIYTETGLCEYYHYFYKSIEIPNNLLAEQTMLMALIHNTKDFKKEDDKESQKDKPIPF